MPQARYRCIVAAVSLKRNVVGELLPSAQRPLAVAHALAKRLGARLRVVTVFEPTHAPPWGDMPMPNGIVLSRGEIYRALRLGRDAALLRMKAELAEAAKPFEDAETIASVVEAADAAQGIVSEAVCRAADLVVVGTSRPSSRQRFSGFSTAVSLMGSSPTPVLVVPEETDLPLGKPRLRLLVADDLRDAGVAVVRHGVSLASQLAPCDLDHLHVVEQSPALFFKSIADEDVMRACEAEMRRRSEDFTPLLQKGSEYSVLVEKGDVAETLHGLVEARAPDLLVFGRHAVVKMRPFMIGRMTSNAMLELKRPVLLVPQDR